MLATDRTTLLLKDHRNLCSLHDLYETNYRWLLRQFAGIDPLRNRFELVTDDLSDPAVFVTVLERHRYTIQYHLTHVLPGETGEILEPDLEVRVYHDAKLAETYAVGAHEHVQELVGIDTSSGSLMQRRWAMNSLLNKWLGYLRERGYRPATISG